VSVAVSIPGFSFFCIYTLWWWWWWGGGVMLMQLKRLLHYVLLFFFVLVEFVDLQFYAFVNSYEGMQRVYVWFVAPLGQSF
jgi:hypothetical protein